MTWPAARRPWTTWAVGIVDGVERLFLATAIFVRASPGTSKRGVAVSRTATTPPSRGVPSADANVGARREPHPDTTGRLGAVSKTDSSLAPLRRATSTASPAMTCARRHQAAQVRHAPVGQPHPLGRVGCDGWLVATCSRWAYCWRGSHVRLLVGSERREPRQYKR